MQYQTILYAQRATGVAEIKLNRPAVNNAIDARLIQELTVCLQSLAETDDTRVLLLTATGHCFSAGADINWMLSMANKSQQENFADAEALAGLLKCLYDFPKPTIAVVDGAAYGGAVGLISCCDLVLATKQARFCLSEVKLGLVPATISPYVARAIGVRQAHRYMLTAEVIDADKALAIGLIHELLATEVMAEKLSELCACLLQNGPVALSRCKAMLHRIGNQPIDSALMQYTSALIAELRITPEAQAGLKAFLDKRPPQWCRGDDEDDSSNVQ